MHCQDDGENFGYELKFLCDAKNADDVWKLVNANDRVYSENPGLDYFHSFFLDWAKKDMKRKNLTAKTYDLNTGIIYFFEVLLRDEFGRRYISEPLQIIWWLTPTNRKCITSTRRGTKSSSICQVEALYNAVMKPAYPTLIITQGTKTASTALEMVDYWVQNEPLLARWAMGTREPWTKQEKWFKNRSYIMTHTGSSTEKLRGMIPPPRAIIRDELAFHEGDNPETVILSLGLNVKAGFERYDAVTSTPMGTDNPFTRVQKDMTFDHFFHPLFCPKNFKRYHCDETCEFFSWHGIDLSLKFEKPIPECKVPLKYDEDGLPILNNVFWRVPRVRIEEVMDAFREIGMMRFEQEFFLRPYSLEGNLFNKSFLDKYVFDKDMNVESMNMKDNIVLGVDYGLTKSSRTVIAVGKVLKHEADGDLIYKARLINLIVSPVGQPYSDVARLIANDIFDSYNVITIVADANTPTKDHVENELIPLLQRKRGFDQVIAYHTLGHQGKDYMAKAQLLDFMRSKFEFGERLRFFKDQDLYSEMLSLRGKETAQGNLQIESNTTTDRFMACMYMTYGALGNISDGNVFAESGPSLYGEREEID